MLFELTNPEIAIMMMGLFLFAVLLGFPIAFTLMAMGIGFGYYAYYDPALMENIFDNRIFRLFINNTYSVMDNTVLTAVPLFLFMGYLVERAGIVARLFFAIRLASHGLPASMAVARRNGDQLSPLKEEIEKNGGKCFAYSLDARKEEDVINFINSLKPRTHSIAANDAEGIISNK